MSHKLDQSCETSLYAPQAPEVSVSETGGDLLHDQTGRLLIHNEGGEVGNPITPSRASRSKF